MKVLHAILHSLAGIVYGSPRTRPIVAPLHVNRRSPEPGYFFYLSCVIPEPADVIGVRIRLGVAADEQIGRKRAWGVIMRQRNRNGFTLVELLVVVGIIAILISILLPVLSKALEQARAVRCSNNQRQIVLAMTMYANDNKGTLPLPYHTWGPNPHGPSLAIWMDSTPNSFSYNWQGGVLWPYVGSKDAGIRSQLFTCPSDFDPRVFDLLSPGFYATRNYSYVFNGDLYQMTGYIQDVSAPSNLQRIGARLQQIKGPEHKVLTAESSISIVSGASFLGFINNGRSILPARHAGRAYVGMADGHVELFGPAELSNPMPGPTVTIAGAKVPPQYAYYFLIYRF